MPGSGYHRFSEAYTHHAKPTFSELGAIGQERLFVDNWLGVPV